MAYPGHDHLHKFWWWSVKMFLDVSDKLPVIVLLLAAILFLCYFWETWPRANTCNAEHYRKLLRNLLLHFYVEPRIDSSNSQHKLDNKLPSIQDWGQTDQVTILANHNLAFSAKKAMATTHTHTKLTVKVSWFKGQSETDTLARYWSREIALLIKSVIVICDIVTAGRQKVMAAYC